MRMTRRSAGSSLVEVIVSCALFTVFMVVALGLFTGMTRVVNTEQKPGERMAEGRIAALTVARRIRNSQAFLQPTLRGLLSANTEDLTLRDGVKRRTVRLRVVDGVLCETYYPFLYNPLKPGDNKAEKALLLTPARSFRVISGGFEHPTRVTVEIVLTDGRQVRAVTNLREAI